MTNEEQLKIKSLLCGIFDLPLDRTILTVCYASCKTTFTVTNGKQFCAVYIVVKEPEKYKHSISVRDYSHGQPETLVESTSDKDAITFLEKDSEVIRRWADYVLQEG